MELILGLAAGAGALLGLKRGRKVVRSAIGWTARKSGWVASRVRASLHETASEARSQYELGRAEAAASAAAAIVPPAPASSSVNGRGTIDHSLAES